MTDSIEKGIEDITKILNGEKCRVGDLDSAVRKSVEELFHDLGAEKLNEDDIVYLDKKKFTWIIERKMHHEHPKNMVRFKLN